MKKLTNLFSFLTMATIAILVSSCGKTETTDPTIVFDNSNATSVSVEVGGIFNITALMNSDAKAELKKLTVTKTIGGISNTTDYDLSGTSSNKTITDTMPSGVSSISYTFLLLDNKDKTASATFTANLKQSAFKSIDTYNQLQIANQNDNSGQQFLSFTPVSGVATFTLGEAKLASSKIDVCYGSATTSGNFLAAPASSKAKLIYDNSGTEKLSTWAVLNNTQFKKTTLTYAQFTAMNNDSAIINNADGVGMSSEITNITTDQAIAFVARNKKGIMYIKNATGSLSNPGSVQIEWKIQQ
ncbi:MAG: hypothetical protein HYZ42_00865 [Bacteroidetes bacterium]|nr:hypothetical protein [Bacteroidota bacterium]